MTPPIVHEKEFVGIRVTQNVWTTPAEIDVFAATVLNAMKEGIADRSLVYETALKLFTRAGQGPREPSVRPAGIHRRAEGGRGLVTLPPRCFRVSWARRRRRRRCRLHHPWVSRSCST